MKNAIVVLPYTETARLFHASKSTEEEAYVGENNQVVYYEHMAKKLSLADANVIATEHPNRRAFVRTN